MNPTISQYLSLLLAFDAADKAGLGIRSGFGFEAYPGLEGAAADFIEQYLDDAPAELEVVG